MPSWNWGEFQSEDGVVHQSTANTDHNDAATLKQGYDYATFSEITPDPVACWPFHEDSGSTAYDLAGTNDGMINGATVGQTGLLGTTAYSFDGTDDYVAPTGTFFGNDTFTITAWIKTSASNDVENISEIYDGSFPQLAFGTLDDGSNNTLYGRIKDGGGDEIYVQSTTTVESNTWRFSALTRNGSTGRLYIDGVEEDSASNANVASNLSGDINIGRRPDNSNHFGGEIADVRIYDTALTATQIQTLYDVVATQGTWAGTAKPL